MVVGSFHLLPYWCGCLFTISSATREPIVKILIHKKGCLYGPLLELLVPVVMVFTAILKLITQSNNNDNEKAFYIRLLGRYGFCCNLENVLLESQDMKNTIKVPEKHTINSPLMNRYGLVKIYTYVSSIHLSIQHYKILHLCSRFFLVL